MNFLRTLSGAFATSIATTAWENNTAAAHADLAGQVDRSDEATRSLLGSGMDMDSVRSVLDGMSQGQSVMLATNEIMATCALAFCVASALIWLAPRAGRVVDMSKWAIERPEGGCRWRNTH
jgi:DHA2 family multidrug resistance protein